MTKKLASLLAVALAGILIGPGCSTNTQGDDAVPVYITVSATLTTPIFNLATDINDTLRQPEAILTSRVKNPAGGSSAFLDVKMDDYLVEWERVDGGTKAPASEVFPTNIVVPAGGTTTLNNYEFMSLSAWRLGPLDQLYPFNGGVDRETGRTDIRCKMKVTFRGHTLAGESVYGTGTWNITFVYLAAATAPVAVEVK